MKLEMTSDQTKAMNVTGKIIEVNKALEALKRIERNNAMMADMRGYGVIDRYDIETIRAGPHAPVGDRASGAGAGGGSIRR